jgi:transposase, IS5 family
MGLEKMRRIYFLQQWRGHLGWYNLSDPAAEEALYDSETMRRFVGIEYRQDTIPDESTMAPRSLSDLKNRSEKGAE